MPDTHYLYALVCRGAHRPFYIGATCDPTSRRAAHRRRFGGDFSLTVLESSRNPMEIARLETELIAWYLGRKVTLQNRALISYYRGAQPKLKTQPLSKTPSYAHLTDNQIIEWVGRRIKRIEKQERIQHLKEVTKAGQIALAEMVADGSAERIAAAYLAKAK